MTAILSWFNKETQAAPYLMTVGDSKISGIQQSTLTLEGAKILELQIRCKDISSLMHQIYFHSSISFSFAGSTLVGLNVYCALQTIFSNLGGSLEINNRPDYKSLSEKAKDILLIYSKTIRSVSEIMLSGFCPKTNIPFIAIIRPEKKDEEINYVITYMIDFSKMDVAIIGDKKTEILKMISNELDKQQINSIEYWRTPAKVLKKIIEENLFDTIGGNIQMTTVNTLKFETYSMSIPIKGQEDKATMKFRNIDIFDEIGLTLGDCYVAINGMKL